MRPDINTILNKPFLLKYIKLNLIRQISNNSNNDVDRSNLNKNLISTEENSSNNRKDHLTSSSSSESSRLILNFNMYPKSPSIDTDSLKNTSDYRDTITFNEDINLYKIEFESSNNSSNGLFSPNKINSTSKECIQKEEDMNSVFTKIEKLKKFLENYLGLENFLEIYFQINDSYLNGEKNFNIDFTKYNINDIKSQKDVIKLIKSLIRLENNMFNK